MNSDKTPLRKGILTNKASLKNNPKRVVITSNINPVIP